jgi:putative oxidoreductase
MTEIANANDAGVPTLPGPVGAIVRLHNRVFDRIEALAAGWFNGFAARFVFASLLLVYYLNSGWNKLGDGFFGFLFPSSSAYITILPPVMEQYGYDVSAIPFFPWHIIVLLGTWGEILLPVLVVIGLFGRIAALGMIVFVMVQSYVDIAYLGLEPKFIGAMFDRLPDAVIFDQRLLWIFVLVMIVVNGPGKLSADHLLARRFR